MLGLVTLLSASGDDHSQPIKRANNVQCSGASLISELKDWPAWSALDSLVLIVLRRCAKPPSPPIPDLASVSAARLLSDEPQLEHNGTRE